MIYSTEKAYFKMFVGLRRILYESLDIGLSFVYIITSYSNVAGKHLQNEGNGRLGNLNNAGEEPHHSEGAEEPSAPVFHGCSGIHINPVGVHQLRSKYFHNI